MKFIELVHGQTSQTCVSEKQIVKLESGFATEKRQTLYQKFRDSAWRMNDVLKGIRKSERRLSFTHRRL